MTFDMFGCVGKQSVAGGGGDADPQDKICRTKDAVCSVRAAETVIRRGGSPAAGQRPGSAAAAAFRSCCPGRSPRQVGLARPAGGPTPRPPAAAASCSCCRPRRGRRRLRAPRAVERPGRRPTRDGPAPRASQRPAWAGRPGAPRHGRVAGPAASCEASSLSARRGRCSASEPRLSCKLARPTPSREAR